MRHVLEGLVARAEAGRAAEVVDRDRGMTGSGEALRQLLVEREQAAHVGKDDDARGALLAGEIGAELRAVAGRQRQVLARRTAGDDPEALGDVGHDRVKGKAHGSETYPCGVRTITASVIVEAPRRRGRAALDDPTRWASWIDGFGHVFRLDDHWPQQGARRIWDSRPAGRGRVMETATAFRGAARSGRSPSRTPRVRGFQRVRFESDGAHSDHGGAGPRSEG